VSFSRQQKEISLLELKQEFKIKKKAIIIGNGEQPPEDLLRAAVDSGLYEIICADGGYHHAERLGIVPDIVLGDMDSLSDAEISKIEGKIAVRKFSGQNDTDVEKAIIYCYENKIKDILLFSVTGKLIDHELSNIVLLFRYAPSVRLRIVDNHTVLEAVTGRVTRMVGTGARVSFYAFQHELNVMTQGLRYQLPENKLIFGKQESTGNIAENDSVSFEVTGGYMLLIIPAEVKDLK
jgi:thiamine pyrophosphokinase